VDKETLDKEIQRAFQHYQTERLKFDTFHTLTGISKKQLYKHYDTWKDACEANGGKCGPTGLENLKPNIGQSKEYYREAILRVAKKIAPQKLTLPLLLKNANFSERPIRKNWGSWTNAAKELGLELSENYHETIPLKMLADDFLKALDTEKKKIPTLVRISRLSGRSDDCYRKNGYPAFKKAAIEYLLKNRPLDETTRDLLKDELVKITGAPAIQTQSSRPHEHGRMLGFRAFACVPTYENEVVAMFGAIADEIGFEIISNRAEFPDCKANRKIEGSARNRYKECLIEFELRSSDFKTHKHPVDGCDLIVCWEHDWKDCPLEVLELKKAIQPLSGWRES
jgi:hypothetical protein